MRKIYVRRKETTGFLPKEVLVGARVTIGSIYVGRQPLKGVEGEEAKKYLPSIIGIPYDHPDFPMREKDYWASLRVKVPFEGKELDISVHDDGSPINIEDYIAYKWLLKHRMVADSKEEMNSAIGKKFYIYDPKKDLLKKNKQIQVAKEADKEFLKASTDVSRMKRLLRVLSNANPDKLTNLELENTLYDFKTKSPALFHKAAIDKDLDLKDEIAELIQQDIIRKIGNQHIHGDETIGDDLTDTLIYFKNKKNSGAINAIRAKLKAIK
tara:strand:+ start:210 stop:1013 length:804 start_codon:yes stop_codon:yes gene_type:complete